MNAPAIYLLSLLLYSFTSLSLHGQKPESPMGKTWVIFIENSNYELFASLEGPAHDVDIMKSALTNYKIDKIIHKKNLTKKGIENFFGQELISQLQSNGVNSLLLWYAGHGKSIHETSYWVPIDARRDDENTYFNTSKLKESLLSYTESVEHVLVVTDACESGSSFYQSMRSINTNRLCDNNNDTQAKSSQVYSSSGYELAINNSQFTVAFASSLANNASSCIAIESIVVKVNTELAKSNQPKPQFGKIEGLEDDNGTFFFVGK